MHRREFLAGTGALLGIGLLKWPPRVFGAMAEEVIRPVDGLPLVKARADRIIRLSVCLRPFRAQGPNLSVEQMGEKTVVHNYGHGGSGWSLSWGCGTVATQQAMATGERTIAVIGCGAIGLTSAILLQRAGAKVTIYAKQRPPDVFSSNATGVWSPDSRISLREAETPAYVKQWEELCRNSFRSFQNLLSLPGQPVEWFDRYTVSDVPIDEFRKRREEEEVMKFSRFTEQVKDLTPASEELPGTNNLFRAPYVRRATTMMFNLTTYAKFLVDSFVAEGGRIERREFHSAADFRTITEKTIVNCTGYGPKALLDDKSITPVRGQLAALIPQPDINYGLTAEGVSMVPRRDGIIIQASQKSDFGSTDLEPRRSETEQALEALGKIYARMAMR